MKMLGFLALLGICLHGAAGVTHSLKYFYTGSSGVPNFPEFVAVGLVDEAQMFHYDSNTRRAEPKQDWMRRVTADDPQYWERQTERSVDSHQTFKANIGIAKQRFNQTGGAHVFQQMYGCEWDDETNETNGFYQFGYDGEDFISLDLKTETWIAPKQDAVSTRQKWDSNKARIAYLKNYLTQICPDWLKKYLDYGRSSLLRKDLPSVSLLQKTPSSPVSCHATGFYPDRATMFNQLKDVSNNFHPWWVWNLMWHKHCMHFSTIVYMSRAMPGQYFSSFGSCRLHSLVSKMQLLPNHSPEAWGMTILSQTITMSFCVLIFCRIAQWLCSFPV